MKLSLPEKVHISLYDEVYPVSIHKAFLLSPSIMPFLGETSTGKKNRCVANRANFETTFTLRRLTITFKDNALASI